ncbi:YbjN domain-containing protein [Mesorhizobium sp. AR10]|uniref:YbjN domain-containing protein n=1 Tax=Mesorhizobium sp. AR10 TaxID=2865839 RepID=UPI00215EB17D|nr:YbjN domain-containing protein [Mesorhizobium sp. AR10]UVK37438.1 YbjN domain-containing protein [Mesorhizobium sp. AR10]
MARLAHVVAFAFPLVLPSATTFAASNTPAAASPDVLTGVTVENVRDAVQDGGYRAQIKEDSTGTYVASASGGQSFFVSLGGCDDKKVCKSILFESGGWTPKTPLTVDALDKFHYDNSGWGNVAKYNDGKYYANYRVTIVGGVTKAWLQSNVEAFATTMESFVAFMRK